MHFFSYRHMQQKAWLCGNVIFYQVSHQTLYNLTVNSQEHFSSFGENATALTNWSQWTRPIIINMAQYNEQGLCNEQIEKKSKCAHSYVPSCSYVWEHHVTQTVQCLSIFIKVWFSSSLLPFLEFIFGHSLHRYAWLKQSFTLSSWT